MEKNNSSNGVADKVTAIMESASEKVMGMASDKIPAVKKSVEDKTFGKIALIINASFAALVLVALYALPAVPALKGGGSMTFFQLTQLINQAVGGQIPVSLSMASMFGNIAMLALYLVIGGNLYTIFSGKIAPYVTARLLSSLALVFTFLTLIFLIGDAKIGLYLAFVFAIFVAISGLAVIPSNYQAFAKKEKK